MAEAGEAGAGIVHRQLHVVAQHPYGAAEGLIVVHGIVFGYLQHHPAARSGQEGGKDVALHDQAGRHVER